MSHESGNSRHKPGSIYVSESLQNDHFVDAIFCYRARLDQELAHVENPLIESSVQDFVRVVFEKAILDRFVAGCGYINRDEMIEKLDPANNDERKAFSVGFNNFMYNLGVSLQVHE